MIGVMSGKAGRVIGFLDCHPADEFLVSYGPGCVGGAVFAIGSAGQQRDSVPVCWIGILIDGGQNQFLIAAAFR